jgi:hypothetical protein
MPRLIGLFSLNLPFRYIQGPPANLPKTKTPSSSINLEAIESDIYIPKDSGDEWYGIHIEQMLIGNDKCGWKKRLKRLEKGYH